MDAAKAFLAVSLFFMLGASLVLGQQSGTSAGDTSGGLCCCLGQMSMFIAPFALMLGAFGLWGVFVICYLLLIIYGLYRVLTKDDWANPNDKIAWVLAIIFLPIIGTIIFLIYNRSKAKDLVYLLSITIIWNLTVSLL
jgi:hypothetical protein